MVKDYSTQNFKKYENSFNEIKLQSKSYLCFKNRNIQILIKYQLVYVFFCMKKKNKTKKPKGNNGASFYSKYSLATK